MTTEWEIVDNVPGGHRVFRSGDGRTALADGTGRTPDTTDDGVMWTDPERPVTIGRGGTAVFPLVGPDGEEASTVVPAEHAYRYAVAAAVPSIADADGVRVVPEAVARRAYDRARQNLPDKVDLVYAGRGDRLSDEQVQALVTGDDHEVDDELWEAYADARQHYADEELQTLLGDDYDTVDVHAPDLMDDLRDSVLDRDQSDPVADNLRQTPNMLFRYRLGGTEPGDPDGFYVPSHDELHHGTDDERARLVGDMADSLGVDPDAHRAVLEKAAAGVVPAVRRAETARRIAETLGVDPDAHADRLSELVDNAYDGGSVEVVWYASPAAVVSHVARDPWDGSPRPRGTIRWQDPHVLVRDGFNGSGHDVRLDGASVEAPFDPERLRVDSQGPGYGWDKIAGVHAPAYETEWSVEQPEPAVAEAEGTSL